MDDHVDVHAPTAGNGLTHWDTATSGISKVWKTGTTRLRQLHDAKPWGNDSAGRAFEAAIMRDGGPTLMLQQGDRIISDVDILGQKVRTAVTRTRETDRGQAQSTQTI